MKRLLVGVIVGSTLGAGGALAADGFSFAGLVGATEQEAQEGYFAVDRQTMIVVKPDSPLHAYMRAKTGQRVRITIDLAE